MRKTRNLARLLIATWAIAHKKTAGREPAVFLIKLINKLLGNPDLLITHGFKQYRVLRLGLETDSWWIRI